MTITKLPTRSAVEIAWEKYRKLCLELKADPALTGNEAFMNRFNDAHDDWQDLYAKWVEPKGRRAA